MSHREKRNKAQIMYDKKGNYYAMVKYTGSMKDFRRPAYQIKPEKENKGEENNGRIGKGKRKDSELL